MLVDKYAKIKFEYLFFSCLNRKSLHTERFINLKDSCAYDGKVTVVAFGCRKTKKLQIQMHSDKIHLLTLKIQNNTV